MSNKPLTEQQLATIQRLLVVRLDATEAGDGAIALLRQHRPELSLIVVEVQQDEGSSLSYRIPGPVPFTVHDNQQQATIQWMRDQQVDAAIVLAERGRSVYAWAYRCYLAGIPLRIGHSQEFGGQVLSHCVPPPVERIANPHLDLLQTCGLIATAPNLPLEATP